MKKIISLLIVITFTVFNSACVKPKHSIRIENQYNQVINANVGTAQFGSINPGKTTSYKNIPEGENDLSGDITGVVSVSGKGAHKWTLIITSSGGFKMQEDK